MPTLKKCAGLVTFQNEIFKSEGALEVADNLVIDADDTIESRRGFAEYGDAFPSLGDRAKQLLEYKGRILRHYNDMLQYDSDGNGTFLDFSGSYLEVVDNLRIKAKEINRNLYFTTSNGVKKISAVDASDFTTATNYIKDAGGPKALNLDTTLNFTDSGFLPPQSKVAYRVVWGITDNNNNVVLGAPSSRSILTNTSEDINTPETISLLFNSNSTSDYDGSVSNRYILFASQSVQYFVWFSTTANPDQPNSAETVGRFGIEVNIEGLTTSSDIAATAANVIASRVSQFTVENSASTVTLISTESGVDLEDATSSANLTNVVTTVTKQGQITEGSLANGILNFTIPTDANTIEYFYQIYRTGVVTANEVIGLEELDPGDDMNLVFEANLNATDISNGEITVEDITTESFRASGTFLYTNANTGQGILQANERPPLCQDIELFRTSTFYSNTKSAHRKTINLLSTTDFTSGVSSIVIGNSSGVSEYTFVGEIEVTEITCDTFANTVANSYIEINSARDEKEYYIWFDKGSGTDPLLTGKQSIRVDISGLTTASEISQQLTDTLNLILDFTAVDNAGSVTVSNVKNGNTTDAALGAVSPGGSWAVTVTTQGEGEDASINQVLLSNQASIAASIDEQARSLINVINRDSNSPVNAFYLSGVDSLPGIILLESRELDDDQFFVGTADTSITSKFSPELPEIETLTAISTGNPTEITAAGHGLFTGQNVFIYGTDSTPAIQNNYNVTVIDANTFSIPVETTGAGTTGFFITDTVSSTNDERPNRVFYSKTGQPEAVPLTNFIDIGRRDDPIQRILSLRDNLFVLKRESVHIITGTTAPNFGARLLDSSVGILAPDTATVLNNNIYVLSTEGVVAISEGGVRIVSRNIENLIKDVTNVRFDFQLSSFGVSYDTDRSYLLWLPSTPSDTVATQCYRYNTFTQTWTRWTVPATCGVVEPDVDKLYLGPTDRNVIDIERKTFDRTDFADRDFDRLIPSNGVTNSLVSLSSVADIELGDVLLQNQRVTISEFNRLLLQLDLDAGLDDIDYFDTLQAVAGDELNLKLTDLTTKLVIDDNSGTITPLIYSSDFETLQTEYNTLIGQLNDPACDTLSKNYDESVGVKPYETIVTNIDEVNNNVNLQFNLPLISGEVTMFKAIPSLCQWAPQDFGSAETFKQVREGTIIFDQNNFFSATIKYASDRSAFFEGNLYNGKGPGAWGGGIWGDFTWGGEGNEAPLRTLIPKDKQRCRYIKVQFAHGNAREQFRIVGMSLEPRALSTRAYR